MHYNIIKLPEILIFERYSYWEYAKVFLAILIVSGVILYYNIKNQADLNVFF